MNRSYSRINVLRRSLTAATSALATTDGRWALVSTTMTGLVAGSMAWLAASTMPPLHVKTQQASTTFLPYSLFSHLVQAGNGLLSGHHNDAHQAAPPPAHLDDALADEEAGDSANPAQATRTISLFTFPLSTRQAAPLKPSSVASAEPCSVYSSWVRIPETGAGLCSG